MKQVGVLLPALAVAVAGTLADVEPEHATEASAKALRQMEEKLLRKQERRSLKKANRDAKRIVNVATICIQKYFRGWLSKKKYRQERRCVCLGDQSSQTWAFSHRPDWPCHPEERELINSGEYWCYPWPGTTPEWQIKSLHEGDTVYIKIRTAIRNDGLPRTNLHYPGYSRKGYIIQAPCITDQNFDHKDGWYCMKIAWSDQRYYNVPGCAPCKTFTLH